MFTSSEPDIFIEALAVIAAVCSPSVSSLTSLLQLANRGRTNHRWLSKVPTCQLLDRRIEERKQEAQAVSVATSQACFSSHPM